MISWLTFNHFICIFLCTTFLLQVISWGFYFYFFFQTCLVLIRLQPIINHPWKPRQFFNFLKALSTITSSSRFQIDQNIKAWLCFACCLLKKYWWMPNKGFKKRWTGDWKCISENPIKLLIALKGTDPSINPPKIYCVQTRLWETFLCGVCFPGYMLSSDVSCLS